METNNYSIINMETIINKNNALLWFLKNNNIKENVINKMEYIITKFDKNNGELLIDNEKNNFFIKFCPLVDPIKFITNCYYEQKLNNNFDINYNELMNNELFILPLHNNDDFIENMKKIKNKINYPMNCAFIDMYFTFLSNYLGNLYNFPHSIKTYDTFTGIKKDFIIDIGDSIQDIDNDKEMLKNVKNNFVTFIESRYQEMFLESNQICLDSDNEDDFFNESNKNKKPLTILKNITIDNNDIHFIDQENENENNENNVIDCLVNDTLQEYEFNNENNNGNNNGNNNLDLNNDIFNDEEYCNSDNSKESFTESESENDYDSDLDSNISYSSNSHNGDDDSIELITDNIIENEDGYLSSSSESSSDDPEVFVKINKMPVQSIIMEKCENTLDYLLENELINFDELKSALFQVIMILLSYQKAFRFTHNDLHTNNIMYNITDETYIYYKYGKQFFKVPTFGKLYKIIDFGRSIFTFKNITFASDSFNKNEDADTQYNCEPFFDEKLKRIDNNLSFDLCRLGTSIFDFFIHDIDNVKQLSKQEPVIKLIVDWVSDDNNKNILYKSNGETRYPGFKIYKMIARTVHNHLPENEINKELFNEYIISNSKNQKKFNSKKYFIDINKFIDFYKK